MYKSLRDVERVVEKRKPDAVLDLFIESYLEGLYYIPLEKVKAGYESLLEKTAAGYPDPDPVQHPQIWDEETQTEIDDPDWTAPSTEEQTDAAEIAAMEAEYAWLAEPENDGDWERTIPAAAVDVDGWRRNNWLKLRRPFYKMLDADALNEALYDARNGDDTKLADHDAGIAAVKTRFPKPAA